MKFQVWDKKKKRYIDEQDWYQCTFGIDLDGEICPWDSYYRGCEEDLVLELKWISVKDRLPTGKWGYGNHPHLSEEVLIANSCSINIGFYNRSDETWYVDEPAKEEWIDKITHWMPLPKNPHNRR